METGEYDFKKIDEAIKHQDNIINTHKEFNKTWDMIMRDLEESDKKIKREFNKLRELKI